MKNGQEEQLPSRRIRELERKIFELELREHSQSKEQEFIREVLYWIDSLVVVIDCEGYIVNFNRASEQLSGYRFGEVKHRPFWDILLLPEEREIVRSTIREVGSKGMPRFVQNSWVTKNGSIRDISWKNSVLKEEKGTVAYILCTGLDVTEQKKAEKTLRESEAKYRELVELANSIIMRLDAKGNITFFNEFAQNFFGYQEEEILGKNVLGTILPPGENSGRDSKSMLQGILDHPEQHSINENENRLKNGDRVWVSWTNKAIRDARGNITGMLCVGNDITERKRLEGQLRQAQKMEALGTLTGGIAHDFNNILAIILGYAEIVQHKLPSEDQLQGILAEIKSASLRGRDIVSQLLSFVRKSDQRQTLIDVNPVIKESLKMLRSTLPANIEFQTSIPEARFKIEADATQIHQVLINLCTNAAHAMEHDGGVLTVGLESIDLTRKKITFDSRLHPGSYLKLIVQDSGEGISPDLMQRIFDPYFTTKEVGKGTGMGLSIVLGIVKAHAGGIQISSQVGRGTRFEIFFPLVQQETVQEKDLDTTRLPTGSEHILFVDDEEALIDLTKIRLEHLGYRVTCSSDPEQALQAFRSNPFDFDLVITDMTMPKMTGDRLTQNMHLIRPDIPVILCTGYSERITRDSIKELGLAGYLQKPLDIRSLAETVRGVLDFAEHQD